MTPRSEHGLQADRGHAACVVAPHLAQASDARGPATPPQRMPQHPGPSSIVSVGGFRVGGCHGVGFPGKTA